MVRSSALCVSVDALHRAGKDHAVIAGDGAAAQRRKADVAGLARAGMAVAAARGMLIERDPRPAAAASPSSSAVPDGASILACGAFREFQKFRSATRAACSTSTLKQVDAEAHIARFDESGSFAPAPGGC
jgi:3-deoxy-D-manno-octulosonic acid (KDO) 8-phosphate synthase